MEPEPDYIAVVAAVKPERFNVSVMRWSGTADSYIVAKCSEALPRLAAEALARSWSAALGGLEIR